MNASSEFDKHVLKDSEFDNNGEVARKCGKCFQIGVPGERLSENAETFL